MKLEDILKLTVEVNVKKYKEETQKLLSVSPTSQTSPNGDFSNEKEHNISLKDNSNELSQISSNDETSLNNNIIPNFKITLNNLEQLNQKSGVTQ